MSFTNIRGTLIGRVRLLIPDRIEQEAIFSDEEILDFLDMEGGVKRATALALETIATDEVLVLKVVKLLDQQTDGAKVSDAILARAKLLRSTADTDEAAAGLNFAIAEQITTTFSAEELRAKQLQRGIL